MQKKKKSQKHFSCLRPLLVHCKDSMKSFNFLFALRCEGHFIQWHEKRHVPKHQLNKHFRYWVKRTNGRAGGWLVANVEKRQKDRERETKNTRRTWTEQFNDLKVISIHFGIFVSFHNHGDFFFLFLYLSCVLSIELYRCKHFSSGVLGVLRL